MTVTATPAGPVAGGGAAAGPVTLLGIRHHGPGSAFPDG